MTTKPEKKPEQRWLTGVLVVLLALWLLMGVGGYLAWRLTEGAEEASRFGESFGFVNSLFSGLALVGVVVAIVLQRKELALQRAELELTRRELKKSANAHQELVKLSALSTLLQTYLEEYQLNTELHDTEYKELLRHQPGRVTTHIWYRILVLRAEIEAINATASGKQADATAVSISDLRRLLWADDLHFATTVFEKRWAELKTAPDQFPAMQGLEAIATFADRLEALEKWMVAVPGQYHNDLQLLRHSVRDFASRVDPRPFPPRDSGGGTSSGPPLATMHHEMGDILCKRATKLTVAVRSGRPVPLAPGECRP